MKNRYLTKALELLVPPIPGFVADRAASVTVADKVSRS